MYVSFEFEQAQEVASKRFVRPANIPKAVFSVYTSTGIFW